jgi:1-pyrroline-5-carboxylate dehydrogenase
VHAHLDSLIPGFERKVLGRDWNATFAAGPLEAIARPIDATISLGRFPTSTTADVKAAIGLARAGARIWNAASLEERLAFAERWKGVLAEQKYQLGLAALYEIGKPSIEGEAKEAVDMLDYYPSELRAKNDYARNMDELVTNETARSVLKLYGVFVASET